MLLITFPLIWAILWILGIALIWRMDGVPTKNDAFGMVWSTLVLALIMWAWLWKWNIIK